MDVKKTPGSRSLLTNITLFLLAYTLIAGGALAGVAILFGTMTGHHANAFSALNSVSPIGVYKIIIALWGCGLLIAIGYFIKMVVSNNSK